MQKEVKSLVPQFGHILVAIEEPKDLSMRTLTELTGSLQARKDIMHRFFRPTKAGP